MLCTVGVLFVVVVVVIWLFLRYIISCKVFALNAKSVYNWFDIILLETRTKRTHPSNSSSTLLLLLLYVVFSCVNNKYPWIKQLCVWFLSFFLSVIRLEIDGVKWSFFLSFFVCVYHLFFSFFHSHKGETWTQFIAGRDYRWLAFWFSAKLWCTTGRAGKCCRSPWPLR